MMRQICFALLLVARLSAAETSSKAIGSPNAPITMEVFSDFQCPHCRLLHFGALKKAQADCVPAGKVRIVNRDFPLPQHAYARLAAEYADAAARIGKYEPVCDQLFQQQDKWGISGDVDGTVAAALNPADMAKVRKLVRDPKSVAELVAEIERDQSLGNKIPLTQTPTMVLTYKGKPYNIVGDQRYELLKQLIDGLLTK